MPVRIKPVAPALDPGQVRIALFNDNGDAVVLRCRSLQFREQLLPHLGIMLEHFTIHPRKGD